MDSSRYGRIGGHRTGTGLRGSRWLRGSHGGALGWRALRLLHRLEPTQRRGCLLLASGPDASNLHKRGVALQSVPGCENPKEAEIALADDDRWRLFFEYAQGDASRIGIADSIALTDRGPSASRRLSGGPRLGIRGISAPGRRSPLTAPP